MGYGRCVFRAIYDGRPYYDASVAVYAELEETSQSAARPGLTIEWDPRVHFGPWLQWQMGVQFGVAYVWSALPEAYKCQLKVRIFEAKGHWPDARQITFAFATVFALLEALKWEPARMPTFDPDQGTFTFPFSLDANDSIRLMPPDPSKEWETSIWTSDDPGIYKIEGEIWTGNKDPVMREE